MKSPLSQFSPKKKIFLKRFIDETIIKNMKSDRSTADTSQGSTYDPKETKNILII